MKHPWLIGILMTLGSLSAPSEEFPRIIDPDCSLFGFPFRTSEQTFIRAVGAPDGCLHVPGNESWLLYGKGCAFLFVNQQLQGVRLYRSGLPLGMDASQVPGAPWEMANGIRPGMNLAEIKGMLGDQLSGPHGYQQSYTTSNALVCLLFSCQAGEVDSDQRYVLSGILVMQK